MLYGILLARGRMWCCEDNMEGECDVVGAVWRENVHMWPYAWHSQEEKPVFMNLKCKILLH